MGTPHTPHPAKLFIAVVLQPDFDAGPLMERLSREYGAIDYSYGPILFTHTEYYDAEMGTGLKKLYVTFERPVSPDHLVAIKLWTNEIEAEHSREGKRVINIDPGYLTNDKLVLASTKNFFHRIYIDKGIFAEVTLHFRKGKYRYFSWTYPDFREPALQEFLMKARARFVGDLRRGAVGSEDAEGEAA